jgi:hypothetical protein
MGLYDRIMRATDDPLTPVRVNAAAQGAARIAENAGHPGIAAAVAAGAALVVAVDTVMHAPKAAPGTYATFDTDQKGKAR